MSAAGAGGRQVIPEGDGQPATDSAAGTRGLQLLHEAIGERERLAFPGLDDGPAEGEPGVVADDALAAVPVVMRLRNVHKTYLLGVEGVPALRGVSLSIRKGECVVILGKSGGGKTSLLNVMGTIDVPTRGDVHLMGRRIQSRTPDKELAELRLKYIGFVFQSFNLLPTMSCVDNVELPMVLAGVLTPRERRRRSRRLLEQVGMGHRLHHLPPQLSGGEQQRTTIARALALQPEILLCDEPVGDLDAANSAIVLKMLMDVNCDEDVTLVMVTHDMAHRAYAHRVVHVVDGKVARVERVDPQVRQQALAELASRPAVKEMERKLAEAAEAEEAVLSGSIYDKPPTEEPAQAGRAASAAPEAEAADAAEAAVPTPPPPVAAEAVTRTRKVFLRRPEDYPVHQWASRLGPR